MTKKWSDEEKWEEYQEIKGTKPISPYKKMVIEWGERQEQAKRERIILILIVIVAIIVSAFVLFASLTSIMRCFRPSRLMIEPSDHR